MVFCVGLTGGIASGKSTVASIFSQLGVLIINADAIAKELTFKNQLAYAPIVARYGTQILNKENEIDRKLLRNLIFTNPEERLWLEMLLHPLIRQKIKHAVNTCTALYCMVEIPLLINKKIYPYINRILLVTIPENLQISRVMQRDHCSKEQALAILAAQPDDCSRKKNADDILVNNLGLKKLEIAVQQLHHQYLESIKINQSLS